MKLKSIFFTIILLLLLFYGRNLWARPTTAYDAERVVTGWLKADPQPLGAALGQQVINVETFTDVSGEPIYYIVYLQPSGFVIVPADDLVEPIIGFADDGTYDPSPDNPLGALVTNDLTVRIAMIRDVQKLQATSAIEAVLKSQTKWEQLMSLGEATGGPAISGLSSVSDPRIDPLVQSKWSQRTCCVEPNLACYNYYTPPLPTPPPPSTPDGDPDNYPCGCVATAMSQVMRYHIHPAGPIAGTGFTITVDGNSVTAIVRGGDGLGGPYNWGLMVYEPNCSTSLIERQAIGALCYDTGISVLMSYTASGSTALLSNADASFVNQFSYANSIYGLNVLAGLIDMVNPNLDYSHPVILTLIGTNPEHAVVCDGYGYNYATMYHHLNMGWAGLYDAWYHFCTDMPPGYNSVIESIYNIFVTNGDEIISGRVTDAYGNTLSGVTVTADKSGGGTYQTVTNSRGIYALAHVPSSSTYTVSVTKAGYSFNVQIVNTGTSLDSASIAGNVWGVNFSPFGASVIYVDANASGNNDGTNWTDAYNHLQNALARASSGDTIVVAEGTYKPDQNSTDPNGSGDRNATFQLISGVEIYGGFPSGGCNNWSERDINANLTILSGDIGVVDSNTDNSYHVVTGSGVNNTVVLDGFTITAGNSSSGPGMYCNAGSPTISNCTFSQNYSAGYSGSIYNTGSSQPTLRSCLFSGNTGQYGGAIHNTGSSNLMMENCILIENSASIVGAGIENRNNSTITIINCTFIRNSAGESGGAIYNESGFTIINCTFTGNTATVHYGGAIRNQGGAGEVVNCIFVGNKIVDKNGGAVWNYNWENNVKYSNCVFSNNKAGNLGGGIYNYSTSTGQPDPCIVNCIFWNNEDSSGINELSQIYNSPTSDAIVSYSCIQDDDPNDGYIPYGGAANNNIDDNPLFERNPNDGGDGWGNANDDYGDLHLSYNSPCIDTAGNSKVPADVVDIDGDGDTSEPMPEDIEGHYRFADGDCNGTSIVDMGAYEFAYLYIGDLDGDCDIDFNDFAIFAKHWLVGVE